MNKSRLRRIVGAMWTDSCAPFGGSMAKQVLSNRNECISRSKAEDMRDRIGEYRAKVKKQSPERRKPLSVDSPAQTLPTFSPCQYESRQIADAGRIHCGRQNEGPSPTSLVKHGQRGIFILLDKETGEATVTGHVPADNRETRSNPSRGLLITFTLTVRNLGSPEHNRLFGSLNYCGLMRFGQTSASSQERLWRSHPHSISSSDNAAE